MRLFKFFGVCFCTLGLTACTTGRNVEPPKKEPDVDLSIFKDCKETRFSSYYGGVDLGEVHYLKQVVPYDDTYTVETDENTKYIFYDVDGYKILSLNPNCKGDVELKKDDVVYGIATAESPNKNLGFSVTLKEHNSLLPYDPINIVDAQSLLNESKTTSDPLTACNVSYTKREGGLYINCNNPEKLTDSCLNKALTRNDVSNQEVFFTFEHNNGISGSFYYGYQVINKGTEDIYVTVKNIGYHLSGPGCWLGEKEWIDFYNTEFKVKGYDEYTDSQKSNFDAYFGFGMQYKTPNNQPITYRIPAGKYIYVMGGTTKDAYNNINVFKTANTKVSGGASNGAVLFDVVGEGAEAAFYVYKDPSKVGIDNDTHQGYVAKSNGVEYGRQYVGYDNCHGVVDANLTWEFNDNTKGQYLPVTYTNYYDPNVAGSGNTPYGKINSTAHTVNTTKWQTHLNPQSSHTAVGTDMTKYYTIDSEGNPICIDSDHFDGLGYTANIGNWMIDYMENYTFVNHGEKERKVKVSFTNSGSVAVLVRDKDGKYIEGTAQYTIVCAASNYGTRIADVFEYTVTIPAHSYVQFTVEYNLLANSNGSIIHTVLLGS